MKSPRDISLVVLRVALGWIFLYAGYTKVIDPTWSAEGYLKGAKTFSGFYGWLASADMLAITNFLNEWGLTLLGVALILGIFVRFSALAAAAMMLLYYFPVLEFPLVDHSYIVDEHIVYAVAFVVLAVFQAGRAWGLDSMLKSRISQFSRFT